ASPTNTSHTIDVRAILVEFIPGYFSERAPQIQCLVRQCLRVSTGVAFAVTPPRHPAVRIACDGEMPSMCTHDRCSKSLPSRCSRHEFARLQVTPATTRHTTDQEGAHSQAW